VRPRTGRALRSTKVNLLHNHLVDLLLDAAAMGRAMLAGRDLGLATPRSFLRSGTMNPEEGELRPQLLDPVRAQRRGAPRIATG